MPPVIKLMFGSAPTVLLSSVAPSLHGYLQSKAIDQRSHFVPTLELGNYRMCANAF